MAKRAASKAPRTKQPAKAPAPAPETGGADGSLSREAFMNGMAAAADRQGTPTPPETPAGSPPESGASDTDPLAVLAAGEADITGDGKPAEPAGDGTGPRTLKTIAETLGISVEDAYAIELSIDLDGKEAETLTLGQLKDRAAKASNLDARTLEFEETRERQENDLIRAKQELQEILSSLPPGSVDPALLAKARDKAAAHRKAEAERMIDTIPEWQDDERQAHDRAGMQAHLAEYGFDPKFLDGAMDHRLVKYMRDNWRRLESVRNALKKTTEVKPTGEQPSRRRESGAAPVAQPALPSNGAAPLTSSQMRDAFRGLR